MRRWMRRRPDRQVDTGLTPVQVQARQEDVRTWAERILRLMDTTGCTARDALRAVEDADRQQAC